MPTDDPCWVGNEPRAHDIDIQSVGMSAFVCSSSHLAVSHLISSQGPDSRTVTRHYDKARVEKDTSFNQNSLLSLCATSQGSMRLTPVQVGTLMSWCHGCTRETCKVTDDWFSAWVDAGRGWYFNKLMTPWIYHRKLESDRKLQALIYDIIPVQPWRTVPESEAWSVAE